MRETNDHLFGRNLVGQKASNQQYEWCYARNLCILSNVLCGHSRISYSQINKQDCNKLVSFSIQFFSIVKKMMIVMIQKKDPSKCDKDTDCHCILSSFFNDAHFYFSILLNVFL